MSTLYCQVRPLLAMITWSLLILPRLGACKAYEDDFSHVCSGEKTDPDHWKIEIEDASRAFAGLVVAIDQPCGVDQGSELPFVEFEVTEAFKGTTVGDQIWLIWSDGTTGCPPNVSIGEEWVIVPSGENLYYDDCDPGFPLSDPESEDLLSLLRSQSAT